LSESFHDEFKSFDDIEREYEDLGGVNFNNIWDWVIFFRWIINAVFIGLPFTGYLVFSLGWNVVLNIAFNRWWAGGNLYLVINSLFNLIQAWNGFFLMFEFPAYLDWFKVSRVFSLEAGVVYNAIYFWQVWEAYKSIWLYDYETQGPMSTFEVLKVMYLVYNLILHIPIVPLNIAIIAKEFEISKFQLIGDWSKGQYTGTDGEALQNNDFGNELKDFFWPFNPLNWINVFWYFFMGVPFWDLFKEL